MERNKVGKALPFDDLTITIGLSMSVDIDAKGCARKSIAFQ